MPARPIETRFHEYYEPEPNTGCWLWTGKVDKAGYGTVVHDWKTMRAHRVSWWLEHGTIPPPSLFVCHKCDVPSCVNPAHLFLGTASDNSRDCWKKGRGKVAARRPNGDITTRLMASDVREIRALAVSGMKHSEIAIKFKVRTNYVWMVAHRVTWDYLE